MGFLWFILMLAGTYLLVGPAIMCFYTATNLKEAARANRAMLFGLILSVAYILLWVLFVCVKYLRGFLECTIPAAVIGLICAIVTFNKNKEQVLINNEVGTPIENRMQGTDLLFSDIIRDINHYGIDYIGSDNEIPFICEIIRYFDKSHIEWVIKEFRPNLNLKFYNKATESEMSILDYVTPFVDDDIFRFLLEQGFESANYYTLIVIIMAKNSYNKLSDLLRHHSHKFNINGPLVDAFSVEHETLNDLERKITLLDYAVYTNKHDKIIELLESYGAKSSIELIDNNDAQISIVEKVQNIYDRKLEVFSKAEIVKVAISLESFKRNLPSEIYQLALDKYKDYQQNKESSEYDLNGFIEAICSVQDEFSEIIGRPIDFDGTISNSDETE